LEPFLFSELIGSTLIDRLQVKPDLILVNQQALLGLRDQVSLPIACLIENSADTRELPDEMRIGVGAQVVYVHSQHTDDVAAIQTFSSAIPGDADLREPLDRVRDALEETLRPGAAA
ncbi:MAG: hypothetical protein KF861_21035, partial [Planctomycetaceae bacterium]|nr:hypothetical protein [Planctomycetaceae bacterium]